MRKLAFLLSLACLPCSAQNNASLLSNLSSPILLKGSDKVAYRDPLLIFANHRFMLFYSYVVTDLDGRVYWYTAWSASQDLQHWSPPFVFTPKSQNLNFSSPGSLDKVGKDWILSLQTIPMNDVRMSDAKVKYPEDGSRLWTMRTRDFVRWTKPELLRVKGPGVSREAMGHMIDPTLVRDKDVPGRWWCFFKQNGKIFASTSSDMKIWNFHPTPIVAGENPEVIVDHGDYLLFYSPENGTGVLRSHDGIAWREDQPAIVLGQKDWPWAETRITAGYVADMRRIPGVGKYVFVCHSMGPGKVRMNRNILAYCNIVIAWSDDLKNWTWPARISE